jgi:N-acetyl-gamma-glutamyl-phosphate reductase
MRVVQAISDSQTDRPLATAFPGLHGTAVGALMCEPKSVPIRGQAVFLAQESGFAKAFVAPLLAAGQRIVDLSADFRLRNPDDYRRWYRAEPAEPPLCEQAVYGMPERYRDALRTARLVANPGCHTTAAILALAPLVPSGLIETRGIVIDSKTGVSGAGRAKSDTIYRFCEANESVRTYGVGGTHRHVPEIEQEIGAPVTFTPHLIPMTRGLLATCYAPLIAHASPSALEDVLHAAYADEPFVVLRNELPSTKDVTGSNYCHLHVAVDGRTGMAIVTSVIDNLGKGAAGQAVQNMNLLFGLPETAGLEGGGQWP